MQEKVVSLENEMAIKDAMVKELNEKKQESDLEEIK